ncbi:translation initiation factor IF-3 [Candidatus Desantisbacteria bacterium]|nr:translation initiation factor IF-3 [Candidatus Desantisbacteria bacterium]
MALLTVYILSTDQKGVWNISSSKQVRINERIYAKEIRVIAADGSQAGIMSVPTALDMAEKEGLDLVEISPDAVPPVCKIMDYGKYKYAQARKAKENKKRQTIVHLKEIKMSPTIDKHDYDFKTKHVKEFLSAGDKVMIKIEFKGRQMAYTQFGTKIMNQLIQELEGSAVVESPPRIEGRRMIAILSPAPAKG